MCTHMRVRVHACVAHNMHVCMPELVHMQLCVLARFIQCVCVCVCAHAYQYTRVYVCICAHVGCNWPQMFLPKMLATARR